MKDNIFVIFYKSQYIEFDNKFYTKMIEQYNVFTFKSNIVYKNIYSRLNDGNIIDIDKVLNYNLTKTEKSETIELINKIEKKLEVSLGSLLYEDRHIARCFIDIEIDYNYSFLAKISSKNDFYEYIYKLVFFLNNLVKEKKFKYVVSRSSGILDTLIIFISNYYGIKAFNFFQTRIVFDKPRFVISNNYTARNIFINKAFKSIVVNNIEPSLSSKSILEKYHLEQQNPYNLVFNPNYYKLIRNIVSILKNILQKRINTKSFEFSFFSSYIYLLFSRVFKYNYQKELNLKNNIENIDKYSYYALGQVPELTILSWAPRYFDTLNNIKQIRRFLPFHTTLVLREHPHNIGRRKKLFYKSLSNIRNVLLSSLKYKPIDLILNSESVITINGTTGWEGLIYKRPVFTFEKTFYDELGLVKRLNSFEEISHEYQDHVDYINSMPDEVYFKKIRQFIDAEEETTYSLEQTDDILEAISIDSAQFNDSYNYWR